MSTASYVPDRGELVWIDFSPHAGHEQAKRRPGLVVSFKRYNALAGMAFVCPISTKPKGWRFEVPLPEDGRITGVVLADQMRNFDWRARNVEFADSASNDLLEEVLARIAPIIGL